MNRFISKTLLLVFISILGVTSSHGQDANPAPAKATETVPTKEAESDPAKTTVAIGEPAPAVVAQVANKGDDAFLMMAAALVIFMSIPGLALFYGGLVRKKNMLSVLMQVFSVFALISVLWVAYGYSLAFTEGSSFFGSFTRVMLNGMTADSLAVTWSKDTFLHEMIYVVFQGAFAAITCGLLLGSFAERIKFSAVLVFCVIWFTFSYLPIAHMVWYWDGPNNIKDAASNTIALAKAGFLFQKGALDFAGGTVVHINAAVAGLIGAYFVGKRRGYGKEPMSPHSLTMTMIGASMLWFGWFGFNAGSALEANGVAGLAFLNTWLAAAMATVSWVGAEWIFKGKPSVLGAASGAVAGLVAITPACGFVGVYGAISIGFLAGVFCLVGVHKLKKLLGADDALDVFGVHGVGGILGALLTGVFAAPDLGGMGIWDYVTNAASPEYNIGSQVLIQSQAILITIAISGVVSVVAYKLIDLTIGLRVEDEDEMMGLDITSHGESAYND